MAKSRSVARMPRGARASLMDLIARRRLITWSLGELSLLLLADVRAISIVADEIWRKAQKKDAAAVDCKSQ